MNLFRQWIENGAVAAIPPSINDLQVEICHFDENDTAQILVRVPFSDFTRLPKAAAPSR
jgi:hypothetical protein